MADDEDEPMYASDGRLQKMEVDFSSIVDEKIPQCEKMVQENKSRLDEAMAILHGLEKQTRTGCDTHSTTKVLLAIVRICFENKLYDALNENIVFLTKKRGLIKQSVTRMIQEICIYVDKFTTPSEIDAKLKLIDTLRTVTLGKIYVENERARLTKILSQFRESEGKFEEAATLMMELQVETYGTMEKREKTEFLLEQMRLTLQTSEFLKTQMISRKINTRYFEEESTEDLKMKFYDLVIRLDSHEDRMLTVCKHYRAVYSSKGVQADQERKLNVLKHIVLYALLAPYDNEQADLVQRIKLDPEFEKLPLYAELLTLFTTNELIIWSTLVPKLENGVRNDTPVQAVFDVATEEGKRRWNMFKNRVVEHNIRVMSKYYTAIRLSRMAQLLDLSGDETEKFLCDLVVSKTVDAKLDRLSGVVAFGGEAKRASAEETLNEWSFNVNKLTGLVNHACHLIAKEQMVHLHGQGATSTLAQPGGGGSTTKQAAQQATMVTLGGV